MIWIIENHEIDQLIIRKMLESCLPQISINSYDSSEKAILELSSGNTKASLILLNLDMPLMSGWDFIKTFTQLELSIPIYLITSSDSIRDREHAKKYPSIRDYILKPLTKSNILKIATENDLLSIPN
jgi:CheY-like chemotaxis protein